MRIEIYSEELIKVYINMHYFKDINFNDNNEIIMKIKELIKKIESRYNINFDGFYKICVYYNKKVGVFLNIIKIEENEFSSGADFRIIIYKDEKFLLETEDYEILDKTIPKLYYNNKFYIDLNKISDVDDIIDMVTIIYGTQTKEITKKAKTIK